jgi:hypothetical protein
VRVLVERYRTATERRSLMLYAVTVKRMMIVSANSLDEAVHLAKRSERESVSDYASDLDSAHLLDSIDKVPPIWRDCLPYEGDGITRIKQYFLD